VLKQWADKALHPWFALRARALRARRTGERELRLLDVLCEPRRAALDVGANKGIYTYLCRKYCERVYAVEAHPELARQLRRSFHRKVQVLQYALSDNAGTATIHVPMVSGKQVDTRGSLETRSVEGYAFKSIEVTTRRLDDLALRDVGFLKIDVEGHELSVLRGAMGFLEREQPTALVEAEERHHPGCTAAVFALFANAGYTGWFLDGSALRPVSEFSLERHQDPKHAKPIAGERTGRYVNNFIFVPARRGELVPLLQARAREL
jgi:FkbM family methyltransferase